MTGGVSTADVLIVGGGIAGVSVAAELGGRGRRVVLLEREPTLAYHTSGRSAAAFLESYGSPAIRALTRAARPLLVPRDGEAPLLTTRPMLWIAQVGELSHLDAMFAENPALHPVTAAGARQLCPVLREDWVAGVAIEENAQDLDVHALLERCRHAALAAGARIVTGAGLVSGEWAAGRWRLTTTAGEFSAPDVVNAAGAWADDVALRLRAAPVGVTPMRRTVAVVTSPAAAPDWPLVADVADRFYFRPEGGGLLVSPADETPSPPCDARAAYEDVALALHRVNEATTLDLRHVRTSWAGLRTFAPDREPVVGADPAHPGLYWLAGQGGYGMQAALTLAQLAAAAVLGEPAPDALLAQGLDPADLSPARFRQPSPRDVTGPVRVREPPG